MFSVLDSVRKDLSTPEKVEEVRQVAQKVLTGFEQLLEGILSQAAQANKEAAPAPEPIAPDPYPDTQDDSEEIDLEHELLLAMDQIHKLQNTIVNRRKKITTLRQQVNLMISACRKKNQEIDNLNRTICDLRNRLTRATMGDRKAPTMASMEHGTGH